MRQKNLFYVYAASLMILLFITSPGSVFSKSLPSGNGITKGTPGDSVSLPGLINEYYSDIRDLNLVYIFKDAPEYFDRFTRFQENWLDRLKMIDFNSLDVSGRVDFILLRRNILDDQYKLEENKKDYQQVAYAVPFADKVIQLQQKRRRGQKLDGMKVAAMLHQVMLETAQAKTVVKKQPIATPHLLDKATEMIGALRKGLKNVDTFYKGYDPAFTWWMEKTYPATDSTLAAYVQWLRDQPVVSGNKAMDSSGIIGHPVGQKEIERLLKFQMIPYSPEELIAIADKQYAWCDAQMKKVSREMGYGDDWKKALEKVKDDYVKPGDQPELINHLEEHAIHFIDSLGLVTIPPLAREAWRMVMLTPEEMRYASYFLGGPEIMVAYAHEDQDYATKEMIMRSGNYGFAHAEVFHELIPGHNLQFFMSRRYKSYRQVFSTPFSVEGWAFYWEMILWDKGYDQTPEEKMGALFWRMTRCARIVFSLNYHLGKWTPQRCIDYLVDRVGLERFSAESEVRRSFTGGYGPLYQLAYMCGALQIYSLHHEIVDGGKMTDRQFNDAFLHAGIIPVEMFRALITNQPLSRDFTTQWHFADHLSK